MSISQQLCGVYFAASVTLVSSLRADTHRPNVGQITVTRITTVFRDVWEDLTASTLAGARELKATVHLDYAA